MTVIESPERIIRTTLANFLNGGRDYSRCVYVLAEPELGIVYVGKTTRYLRPRFNEHFSHKNRLMRELLNGARENGRAEILRLDILIAPNDTDEWLDQTELNLIQMFRPMLNQGGLGE